MCKKILTIILTFSVFVFPGFAAEMKTIVLAASHSENMNTAAPAPEDEKDCAWHLADLLNKEGMAIVETSTSGDAARKVAEAQAVAVVRVDAIFHLSNASSRNPKAAIVVCQASVK